MKVITFILSRSAEFDIFNTLFPAFRTTQQVSDTKESRVVHLTSVRGNMYVVKT